ncbi:hypothetical protein [Cohnella silvisoli]|uniref:Uncharacterized protein n=1 Tax=Cohnella silvisoli TaxID=2873699 RepID=A0ABV1KUF3_9BACL|nr:hypothetical protein [Cohnella silvisoli]MCD9023079.1 hypothetical protein [Cohnella silvisoli]
MVLNVKKITPLNADEWYFYYKKVVSFCDFIGLFLPDSIKKRGDVSPVGATAFAFEIVKSPCYEFTNSNFTISTRGPRKVIGLGYEA